MKAKKNNNNKQNKRKGNLVILKSWLEEVCK